MVTGQDILSALKPHFPALPMDMEVDLIGSHFIDSMGMIEILETLEEAFGITIPDEYLDISRFTTISMIATTVNELKGVGNGR